MDIVVLAIQVYIITQGSIPQSWDCALQVLNQITIEEFQVLEENVRSGKYNELLAFPEQILTPEQMEQIIKIFDEALKSPAPKEAGF